ncbi:MAG: VWA domain-containing protein [Deltaproteobacteria bacterium]|nr:VWA domain-containing protein [Deltaproteobacteria bacterium]
MQLGPGDALAAARAVAAVEAVRKEQFHAALAATLVRSRADREIFDEAFRLFWRDPMGAHSALALLLPQVRTPTQRSISRRLSEAWRPPAPGEAREAPAQPPRVDTFLAYSADEVLRTRDFDQMSTEELARAAELVRRLDARVRPIRTRRTRPAMRGAVDARRTTREALRRDGELARLYRRARVERPPAIVALCDISGSMGRYSEMLLRFLHALRAHRGRGHVFVFATRLTNATRALRDRDPDRALGRVGAEVTDWASGTRLGACLRDFNVAWSRRVLAQGAIVLLVTDGLDRDDTGVLAVEAARLARSCRRLVWLNPLLRYAGFEPRAAGIRALLPHVHEHRPVHDLASLDALARALAGL